MDNVSFDLRSAERIARSVKFTERQSENLTGGRGRFITSTDDGYLVVLLTSDGGAAGSAGTAASWTYTATSLDGSITYGTAMSPSMQRDTWAKQAAKSGWIVSSAVSINGIAPNTDGFILFWCDEYTSTSSTC